MHNFNTRSLMVHIFGDSKRIFFVASTRRSILARGGKKIFGLDVCSASAMFASAEHTSKSKASVRRLRPNRSPISLFLALEVWRWLKLKYNSPALRQFWRRYIVGISWGFRGEKDAWGFFSNPSNSRRFPHECGDSGQSRRFPHAFICVASRVFKLASRVVVRRHAESETPPPRARAARCPRHPLSRAPRLTRLRRTRLRNHITTIFVVISI